MIPASSRLLRLAWNSCNQYERNMLCWVYFNLNCCMNLVRAANGGQVQVSHNLLESNVFCLVRTSISSWDAKKEGRRRQKPSYRLPRDSASHSFGPMPPPSLPPPTVKLNWNAYSSFPGRNFPRKGSKDSLRYANSFTCAEVGVSFDVHREKSIVKGCVIPTAARMIFKQTFWDSCAPKIQIKVGQKEM